MVTIRRIPQTTVTEERMWRSVAKTNECWLWTAGTNADGYGKMGVEDKTRYTHRLAWEFATGDVLTSHDTICHTCDVRNCVRNDEVGTYQVGQNVYPRRGHLYKATQPANVADRDEKGRGHWATGDDNGMRLHPEAVARGSHNGNAFITEDDVVAIRARYAAGEEARALAVEYGFADMTPVFAMLRRTTWEHVPGPSYEEIKSMRAEALGPKQSSLPCVDCGTTTARRVAKGLCDPCYSTRKRRERGVVPSVGENNPTAKLTEDDVRAIRAETRYGMGRVLARRYGVSPGLITNVQQRKIWAHVS